jgi:NAD(P)-dependent dehydrogenase (short-subunit alcohol dehydrogenase family)
MQDFQGKVVVITGGASGIGLGMAERFAREGCKLVLADIETGALERAVKMLEERGTEVIGVQTDVSQRAAIENLLAKTLERFGAVHILCNNAGVQLAAPTWQLTEQQWQWLLGVNLWGVIHGVSVFVPQMLAQGQEAHIVNTSSMSGLLSVPMMSAYQVTKHAVVTLSESLYQELKQQNSPIGVSVLCPAFVQTNLHESDRNRPAEASGSLLPKVLEDAIKQSVTQLVTTGKPVAEIADAVIDAIRQKRVHIITHPELIGAFEERARRIVNAAKATAGAQP